MAENTDIVRARINPKLKSRTEKIFTDLGLSTGEAIRIFFKQVELHQGLPFDVKIPNERTRKAIQDARKGNRLKTFRSINELQKDLDM
jgi:DNA-damage-inducible protein J